MSTKVGKRPMLFVNGRLRRHFREFSYVAARFEGGEWPRVSIDRQDMGLCTFDMIGLRGKRKRVQVIIVQFGPRPPQEGDA